MQIRPPVLRAIAALTFAAVAIAVVFLLVVARFAPQTLATSQWIVVAAILLVAAGFATWILRTYKD